jgi:hypothetical protein
MTSAHLFDRPPAQWECPNCPAVARTPWDTANRFHTCAGLRGLTAPMLRAGTRARVHAVEREDYVGTEDVRLDADGRPVMAVVTVRDDGQDVTVFAPTAYARGES